MTDAKIEMLIKSRDGLRMTADAINDYLETLGPKGTQQDTAPDLGMIIWKNAIGDRGPFEVAERDSNKNNAPFAALTEYLNSHAGKAQVSGYFLWKFTDSSGSIGRKPTQKQP